MIWRKKPEIRKTGRTGKERGTEEGERKKPEKARGRGKERIEGDSSNSGNPHQFLQNIGLNIKHHCVG